MKTTILESETFGNGNRNYFIDFARASNNSNYIKITRSDRQADDSYKRNSVVVFEDDFLFLVESLSMLFTSAAHRAEASEHSQVRKNDIQEQAARGIKSWPEDQRPREKLITRGAKALTDAELLAVIIGSGTPNQTAVDLSAKILASIGNDLSRLSELNRGRLKRFRGIGDAKSTGILASLELARRAGMMSASAFNLRVG